MDTEWLYFLNFLIKFNIMKHFLLAVLSVALLTSCTQSKPKNSLEKGGMKGKIKALKSESYEAIEKFGNIEIGLRTDAENYLYLYDDKGNIIEISFYDKNGDVTFKHHFTYNDQGELTEREQYNKYDSKTNTYKEEVYEDEKLSYKNSYIYDDKGRLLEVRYNNDRTTKMEFDDKGNISTKYNYKDRELISKDICTHS